MRQIQGRGGARRRSALIACTAARRLRRLLLHKKRQHNNIVILLSLLSPRPRPSSETKSRVTNRSSRGGPALLARNQNMDRCGVPLQPVAEVENTSHGTFRRWLFCFLFCSPMFFGSFLHHTFLWQNSADWQGMNDARCFGTDPSLSLLLPRRRRRGDFNDEASQNGHCLCRARAAQTASGN